VVHQLGQQGQGCLWIDELVEEQLLALLRVGARLADNRVGHRQHLHLRGIASALGDPLLLVLVVRPGDVDVGIAREDELCPAGREVPAAAGGPGLEQHGPALRRPGHGERAPHAEPLAFVVQLVEAGIDCIEHGALMSDETLDLMIERGTFLVPTTSLADGMDVSRAAPELQAKAAEVFPRAKETIRKAVERGARIACGTDAPAIPHGKNAKELLALVDRGMTPLQAIRAATTVSAELIDVDDRGRLEAGLLADVIAVPGDPLADIGVTEDVRFVMKGGQVYRHDGGAA
jgi:Amidohydrolase family